MDADDDDEEQAAADESDASDDEEAMEVDGKTAPSDVPMETGPTSGGKYVLSKEAATPGAKGPAAPSKPSAVASGLPQSKEELESLISGIHTTVSNSVLPRLHKCLTAKVPLFTHTYSRNLFRKRSEQQCNIGSMCVLSR